MMVQSPHRPSTADGGNAPINDDIFSPTSAAALALSSLHHFGADQRHNNANSRSLLSLRGTRLFNNNSNASSTSNNGNPSASKTDGGNTDTAASTTHEHENRPDLPTSSERHVDRSRETEPGSSEAKPGTTLSSSPSMPLATTQRFHHHHHHPPSNRNHQYHHPPHHVAGAPSHVWQPPSNQHPPPPPPSQQTPSPPMPLYHQRPHHHHHHHSAPTPNPVTSGGGGPPRNAGGMPIYAQRPPPPMEGGYHHLQHFHSCSSSGSSYPEQHSQRRPYYQEQQQHHPHHQHWNSQQPATPATGSGPGSASSSGHRGYPQPVSVPSSAVTSNGYPNHTMYHSRYPHPPGNEQDRPEKLLARLASCATTLVTPTPKKHKLHSSVAIPSARSSLSMSTTALPYTRLSNSTTTPSASSNTSSHNTSTIATPAVLTTESGAASGYSRKKKSLGVLAENFIRQYQDLPSNGTTDIIVDEAAVQLGVERRRIYDVVNILEAIGLVSKKHKNTYAWLGTSPEHLTKVFGRLQAAAITAYPEDASTLLLGKRAGGTNEKQDKENGSLQGMNTNDNKNSSAPMTTPSAGDIAIAPANNSNNKGRENKSLAKLSQEFLQIFLVGHEILSLPEASDKIQGTTSMEELIAMGTANQYASINDTLDTPMANSKVDGDVEPSPATFSKSSTPSLAMLKEQRERKAAAARGLKTKIRRLYDIANVFLSVGLLRKVEGGDSSRRPNFAWDYPWSAKQLYHLQQQREMQPQPPIHRGAMATHYPAAVPPERQQWAAAVVAAEEVRHPLRKLQDGDLSEQKQDQLPGGGKATTTTAQNESH